MVLESARSTGSRGADSARNIVAAIKKNGEKRPQSARGPRKFKLGEQVEARSHSRTEYRPGNIVKMHSDGTVDVEFGDPNKSKKSRYDQITSIGLKRVKEIVKHKVEQRVRGSSTGKWATVNPHVLKSLMFGKERQRLTFIFSFRAHPRPAIIRIMIMNYGGSSCYAAVL